jgi:hypothetical protein
MTAFVAVLWAVRGTSPPDQALSVPGIGTATPAVQKAAASCFTVSLLDLAGSDERVYALHHAHAEREGKVIDYDAVNVFHVSDGVVTEVREFSQDTDESDAFWA